MTDTYDIYVNNKLCSLLTVPELKDIAKLNNVNIDPKDLKKDICRKLVMCGNAKIKKKLSKTEPVSKPSNGSLPNKKRYENTQELLNELGISNVVDLLGLYNGKPGETKEYIRQKNIEEMDNIIEIADIKKKKEIEKISFMLQGLKGEARVVRFLSILAEKYCSCLNKFESQKGNAICSKAVFNTKGLKGPGKAYQCEPVPILLAPINKTVVLEKL